MIFIYSLCLLFQQNYNLTNYQKQNICKLESTIRTEAKRNSLEPELLASVIFVESSFIPWVVSRAGACGLTQVIPKWTGGNETKKIKYTCNQLKNPVTSIKVGAKILSYAIRVYGNRSENLGLCIYNAGTKCITKKGFYKRSIYVKKVRNTYNKLVSGR